MRRGGLGIAGRGAGSCWWRWRGTYSSTERRKNALHDKDMGEGVGRRERTARGLGVISTRFAAVSAPDSELKFPKLSFTVPVQLPQARPYPCGGCCC